MGIGVIVSLLLLTGCDRRSKEAIPQASEEISEMQTVLQIYAWPNEAGHLEPLIKAFEEENADIKIAMNYIPETEYTQQMMILRNGNKQADCVFFPNQTDAVIWQNKGVLADMGIYLAEEQTAFYRESCGLEDEIYMLPYRTNRWVVLYNKDLFDKRKVDYPSEDWTWDEYARIAVRLTKQYGEDKSWGSLSFEPGSLCWNFPARAAGFCNPLKKADMEAFQRAAKWCYQLTYDMKAQLPYTEQTGQTGYNHDASFLEGNIGMYFGSDVSVASLNRMIEQEGIELHYDIAPLPSWEGEESFEVSDPIFVSMLKDAESTEEAVRFIQFVTGENGAKILAEHEIIPTGMSDDIKEIYMNHSAMPEHREYFLSEDSSSLPPVDIVYAEALDIIRNEVSKYLLQEQSEEKTFSNILEELDTLEE